VFCAARPSGPRISRLGGKQRVGLLARGNRLSTRTGADGGAVLLIWCGGEAVAFRHFVLAIGLVLLTETF
jgi:hypothetical protein